MKCARPQIDDEDTCPRYRDAEDDVERVVEDSIEIVVEYSIEQDEAVNYEQIYMRYKGN